MSRGPLVRRLAPLVMGAAALAGCSVPSNSPAGYDDQVRASFVQGCTGDVPEADGSTTTLAGPDSCGCAYDVFVEQVPYDDDARNDERYAGYPTDAPTFKGLDGELSGDAEAANTLPQDVRDALGDCREAGTGVLAPDGGEPSADATSTDDAGEPKAGDAVTDGSATTDTAG